MHTVCGTTVWWNYRSVALMGISCEPYSMWHWQLVYIYMGVMSHQYPLMNLGFFFFVSSSLGQAKQFVFMTFSYYKKQHLVFSISSSLCQDTTIWCIFALGCFLSFPSSFSSSHCLVLATLFLLIIMVEHPCKMYKKYVVVHYPLLYHLKSVFHDH